MEQKLLEEDWQKDPTTLIFFQIEASSEVLNPLALLLLTYPCSLVENEQVH